MPSFGEVQQYITTPDTSISGRQGGFLSHYGGLVLFSIIFTTLLFSFGAMQRYIAISAASISGLQGATEDIVLSNYEEI